MILFLLIVVPNSFAKYFTEQLLSTGERIILALCLTHKSENPYLAKIWKRIYPDSSFHLPREIANSKNKTKFREFQELWVKHRS